jgi:tripartite-type tricarboxylate transporter receptor subunit TctC
LIGISLTISQNVKRGGKVNRMRHRLSLGAAVSAAVALAASAAVALAASAAVALAASVASAASAAAADPVAEFYQGKQIRFVIRAAPGGNYDLYMRLLARYMVRHMPGAPEALPVNMPGGGGLTALNYTLNVAPQDGTVLTMVTSTAPMDQALGLIKSPNIDLRSLQWIGNMSDENYFLVTSRESGIRALADATKREVRLAGAGAGDTQQILVAVCNSLLGTKFKSIIGYRTGAEMNLAVQRREADGRSTTNLPALFATRPDGAAAFNPLLQVGLDKSPSFASVPLLRELAHNPDQKIVFEFLSRAVSPGRPVATNSKVPADRVAALRRAFDLATKDPQLLDDAKRQKLDISPWTGLRLNQLVTEILNTPAAEIARIRQAIKAGSSNQLRAK